MSEDRSDDAPQTSGGSSDDAPEARADAPARAPRKPRRSREDAPVREASDADALPGFLTRPTRRVSEASTDTAPDEVVPPRRRAPRKKASEIAESGE